jgi:hypothetical protein
LAACKFATAAYSQYQFLIFKSGQASKIVYRFHGAGKKVEKVSQQYLILNQN